MERVRARLARGCPVEGTQARPPPADLAGRLRELQAELQGASLTERLGYVLSLSPWQLTTDDDEIASGRPRILHELAGELAQAERATILAAVSRTHDGDPQTAGFLFEELAKALNDATLLLELEVLDPLPQAALARNLQRSGTAR